MTNTILIQRGHGVTGNWQLPRTSPAFLKLKRKIRRAIKARFDSYISAPSIGHNPRERRISTAKALVRKNKESTQ